MEKKITALLVHGQTEHMQALEKMLRQQGITMQHVGTCQAAAEALAGAYAPPLIFTDTILPDGRWTHVIRLAEGATQPANVIVVARHKDTRLYVEAIEKGAFDFIVPPFTTIELAHVVRCATDNVLDRREASHPVPTAAPLFSLMPAPMHNERPSVRSAQASGSRS